MFGVECAGDFCFITTNCRLIIVWGWHCRFVLHAKNIPRWSIMANWWLYHVTSVMVSRDPGSQLQAVSVGSGE